MATRSLGFKVVPLAGLLVSVYGASGGAQLPVLPLSFARGDVIVSLEPGPVQWWSSTGVLKRILVGPVDGTGEGMAFDAAGNLYVTRWCATPCINSNTVEKFDPQGLPAGTFGSGYCGRILQFNRSLGIGCGVPAGLE